MKNSREILTSLHTSHIDHNHSSDYTFQTELLTNDSNWNRKVLTNLRNELSTCEEFLFSVAFITEGGLTTLANQMKETVNRNVNGKILTSSYLEFNDPKTFRKLLSYPNIEVRVYDEKPLHSKGYIFAKKDHYNLILGSSNLTQTALTQNNEWNIKLSSLNSGRIVKDSLEEFYRSWNNATVLTDEWITEYEKSYIKPTLDVKLNKPGHIIPNTMQTEALRNLENLRDKQKNKALLISSTGTGKTYLSAFDVKNAKPKRMLFVVHREQIAKDALESFKRIMPEKSYGLISGSCSDYNKDYIFTTIQSLSRDNTLNKFSKEHFDYIVIDEAHHSAAKSYLKIINYFTPNFLLGMTATPERSDNYDIFEIFDYNLAYEIRLNDALEENMLCPFHYFGVNDLTLNNESIDEFSDFNLLTDDQRVQHIIENTEYYGYSGSRLMGLIFVSRNEEAEILSKKLNLQGLNTIALSGKNSQWEREAAIEELTSETGKLDYIITVDIFNEGIDIPEVNQIVMLRPTQSAIIFVQQLGRGLRKFPNKDYVVIIDFIGNYKNNFFIPIALSGDKSYNKDTIKEFLIEGNSKLPGASTMDFDQISKERIYKAVNQENFSTMRHLKEQYSLLKNRLGKIPTLVDFINHDSIDPLVIFKNPSFNTYNDFLQKIDKNYKSNISTYENQFLSMITLEFLNGMRLDEIVLLESLINNQSITHKQFKLMFPNEAVRESLYHLFNLSFFVANDIKKYGIISPIVFTENSISFNSDLQNSLEYNNEFKNQFLDIIEFSKKRNKLKYSDTLVSSNMVLYEKYTKKEMCRLFNWHTDEKGVIYGYRFKYNTFPIYVTYHKKEDISDSIKYNDGFISPSSFAWQTKNRRTLESNEVLQLQEAMDMNIPAQLFVQKEDTEKGVFYYLGEMDPVAFEQTTIIDGNNELPIVNIEFELRTPVREDIYDFIVNN
ncbi:DEAD/DEAH box helicase [Erysipelothrix urinaevulpis]|uniref:DEAD/DEAH box helicase n=1 Tax=Erysipelothrix urinaevulpis TaxID=2683717 RepID=UPI00135CBF62|nr:DEAD/DEAH box helicase [Erysipelothrix urinaevulpis]